MNNVESITECVSYEEKKMRSGIAFINGVIWLFLIAITVLTMGSILVLAVLGEFLKLIMSEYNFRKLHVMGSSVSEHQFPEVYYALQAVCDKLGVKKYPRVIILNESSINAFALKIARKRVIVLYTQILEDILDNPEELRFILGHEVSHLVLDHGKRGIFELYKSAAYKVAREMTCDNCGLAASGNLEAAHRALKRIGVGNRLLDKLSNRHLIEESEYIYSGLVGWFIKQNLIYPPLGKRIGNVTDFWNGIRGAGQH